MAQLKVFCETSAFISGFSAHLLMQEGVYKACFLGASSKSIRVPCRALIRGFVQQPLYLE